MKIYYEDEICNIFGCTPEELNEQYAANIAIVEDMSKKAKKTGKKVGNATAQQLDKIVANYKAKVSITLGKNITT